MTDRPAHGRAEEGTRGTGAATPTAAVVAPGGCAIEVHLLALAPDGFSLQRFAEEGIALPQNIARSVAARRMEYFYGRLAARHALAPLGLAHVQIGTGNMREPLWPDGVRGSISHNRRFAAAAALPAGDGRAVGLDLESVAGAAVRAALIRTAVSPAELAYLASLHAPYSFDCLLTLVFSAKESFFKAAFPEVGRYFDFDAVALRAFDFDAGSMRFDVREPLCAGLGPGASRLIHFVMIDADTVLTCCSWTARSTAGRS